MKLGSARRPQHLPAGPGLSSPCPAVGLTSPRALKTQIQACNKRPEPDSEKDGAGGGLGTPGSRQGWGGGTDCLYSLRVSTARRSRRGQGRCQRTQGGLPSLRLLPSSAAQAQPGPRCWGGAAGLGSLGRRWGLCLQPLWLILGPAGSPHGKRRGRPPCPLALRAARRRGFQITAPCAGDHSTSLSPGGAGPSSLSRRGLGGWSFLLSSWAQNRVHVSPRPLPRCGP